MAEEANKKNRVEELIEQANSTKHEALKGAIEKHAEQEKQKYEKELLGQFQSAKSELDRQVEHLRGIRANEKAQAKKVAGVDAAFEQFKTDGDYDAFIKACEKVGVSIW